MSATMMAAESICQRLRRQTRDLHDDAESHAFQRALLRGDISRAAYATWLTQLLALHEALESAMREKFADHPAFALVVVKEQFQAPYLHEDLAALGATGEAALFAPTRTAIDEIERDAQSAPIRLLGGHYVLEGSNNGSRVIARKVRERLRLARGEGDRYLDPYGEAQPAKWAAFKRALDTAPIAPAEADAMVDAARRMFMHIRAMSDAMLDVGMEAAL